VLEHGGDDHQVAAALLHDVVEDHGGRRRLEDVRRQFGDDIAHIVEALSDSLADTDAGEAKGPWRERKEAYLARLAGDDDRVLLVSACDKLHNARSLLTDLRRHGPSTWQRFTQADADQQLWYFRSLVEALVPRVPSALGDELSRTVDAVADLVADPSLR
jgi:(p)ppGpp synthase/HD superfamily hydrolase